MNCNKRGVCDENLICRCNAGWGGATCGDPTRTINELFTLDAGTGALDKCRPREMYVEMPLINVRPVLAEKLDANKDTILKELIDCQGKPVDLGGYWQLDDAKANAAMRPSKLFNGLIDN